MILAIDLSILSKMQQDIFCHQCPQHLQCHCRRSLLNVSASLQLNYQSQHQNALKHVPIIFCNSFCIPVFLFFFASILQALPSEVLFQVISKIFFKVLNLPSHYSKCISKKNMREQNNGIGHRFVHLKQDVAGHFLSPVPTIPLVPLQKVTTECICQSPVDLSIVASECIVNSIITILF